MPIDADALYHTRAMFEAAKEMRASAEMFWLEQSYADAMRAFGGAFELKREVARVLREARRSLRAIRTGDAEWLRLPEVVGTIRIFEHVIETCESLRAEASG